MEKSYGLATRRDVMEKKMAYYLFFFRRFRVKEPRRSETISSDEKRYLHRSARLTSATSATMGSLLLSARVRGNIYRALLHASFVGVYRKASSNT